ncbi:MAG: protein phosphatase 2C domain-containing protein [Acidobacteriota bacterium]
MSTHEAADTDRVIYGRTAGLSYAGITHPGLKRKRNEDTFWVDEELTLFIVADGMGGQRRGAEAGRAAIATIGKTIEKGEDSFLKYIPLGLRLKLLCRKAFLAANEAVKNAAMGGGTTMELLLVRSGLVHLAHVGDSRVYLLRGGALKQLTTDHTVGAEKSSQGKNQKPDDEDEALTRVLGSSASEAKPDQIAMPLEVGTCTCCAATGSRASCARRASRRCSPTTRAIPWGRAASSSPRRWRRAVSTTSRCSSSRRRVGPSTWRRDEPAGDEPPPFGRRPIAAVGAGRRDAISSAS